MSFLPFIVSLLALVLAFGFCVWLLVKDRNFWREEYRTRDREGKEREQQLFDQLLVRTGNRATTEPAAPRQTGVMRQSALDPEDLEIIDSKINERIEMGVITPSQGHMWAGQVRDGSLTTAQLERQFWKAQQNQYAGSVADID